MARVSTRHHLIADLKEDVDEYRGKLERSKVKSLEELVGWNKAHAIAALTDGIFVSLRTLKGLICSKTECLNQILLEQDLKQ